MSGQSQSSIELRGGGEGDIWVFVTASFPLAVVLLNVSFGGTDCMNLLLTVLALGVHQEGAQASFWGGHCGGCGFSRRWVSGGHSRW